MSVRVRPLADVDRAWVRALLRERWAGEQQVVHDTVYEPAEIPGFVAEDPASGDASRPVSYHREGDACEVALLQPFAEGRGVGSAPGACG